MADEKWQKEYAQCLTACIEEYKSLWEMNFREGIDLCESPIERAMLAEFVFCGFGYWSIPVWIGRPDTARPSQIPHNHNSMIVPQFKIGNYKADFAVLVENFSGEVLKMAIECDGHDFHEKTKEQVKHDKKRDRYFVRAGWAVFRFTGSEIFNQSEDCAEEIESHGVEWIESNLIKRGILRRPKKNDG